ncbi:MAG: amidohydrolase family protein, partial [Pseudomonadota bacterium]
FFLSFLEDAGVRAAVAPMFSDLPFRKTIPLTAEDLDPALADELPGAPQDPDPFFDLMSDAVGRWAGSRYVSIMLGVDSPQRWSAELLERAGAFCAEHNVGNHTHLLEAKTQWAMAAARDRRGFVAYLRDFGLAGPQSSFAHFIWFTDADLDNAAEAGVNVVHNPASNLILGSGLQPLVRLMEAGVNVAFGSDGLNAGHMSMFEKTRLAALLPRISEADPGRWPRAAPILRMATVNGAAALGRRGKAGTLEAGQLADFVVLDGRSVALSPRGDLPTQVLFHETGASVRDVYVGGVCVLREGAPVRFDGASTLLAAHEAAARLARDSAEDLARAERFRPGITAMVHRIVAEDCGPCRIAQLS